MSVPTSATATITIAAPAELVYDLISDVTRMGEWSPECVRCDWLDAPGVVGSRFRGHNRSGLVRWSTVARVDVADRPREFSFVTLHRGRQAIATRWRYRLEAAGDHTVVNESFETISTPLLIGLAERALIRNRQSQIETGMAQTLAALKASAEQHRPALPET